MFSLPDGSMLPTVITAAQAATLLGLPRTNVYDLVKRGEFPSPTIHVGEGGRGSSQRIVTRPLLELLGIPVVFAGAGSSTIPAVTA